MHLHLTDEQVALLVAELDRIIENDRYPLSRRAHVKREFPPPDQLQDVPLLNVTHHYFQCNGIKQIVS